MYCGTDCANYREGGKCRYCHEGVTGYFTACDGKKCFAPKGGEVTSRGGIVEKEETMENKKTKICKRLRALWIPRSLSLSAKV